MTNHDRVLLAGERVEAPGVGQQALGDELEAGR